jgi:hypothetical protein
MQLLNRLPFKAERFILVDTAGAETLVVVVKGTFQAKGDGVLKPAEEQAAITLADEYYGEPGQSSVKYASDVSLTKTGTDVVLLGHACPANPPATEVDVVLKVGPLAKTVRIFGDRQWQQGLLSGRLSKPDPFERMPLMYERAFGGADTSVPDRPEAEVRNPVGVGFRAKKSAAPLVGAKAPNLEDPGQMVSGPNDRPPPAGFGFTAPNWEPRRTFGGTYDDKWKKERMPLVPSDFSARFFSCASPGLATEGFLKGNEPVEVVNAGQPGPWTFSLPGVRLEAVVEFPEGFEILPLELDTVVIDADARRVVLTWRCQLNVHGRVLEVGWVKTQKAGGAN